MLRIGLSFSVGVFCFHQLAWLPDWRWGLPAAILLVLCLRLRQRSAAALLGGFVWSLIHAWLTLPAALPDGRDRLQAVVRGQVVSLVEHRGETRRFVFEARQIEGPDGTRHGRWRLRLSWWDAPAIGPGEIWRLPVRLRAAHGFATPGAWDYEGWLYWQGIRYTGYVIAEEGAQRLADAACCGLTRLRQHLSGAVEGLPLSPFAGGVIRAIGVGDRSGLDGAVRELLRATGTSHLMAISGLHVGLVAALGLVGCSALWRRLPPLCGRTPARLAGAAAGVLLAAGYAALAGMSLPTQRALFMLIVFALALFLRRDGGRLHALVLALVLVLLWHPPSVVAAGLWLSFGAVGAILIAAGAGRQPTGWRMVIRTQLTISLVLLPVLAAFGLPISRIGPLVNLLLVPLFGLLIVPVGLFGMLLSGLSATAGGWVLGLLGGLLDLVHQGLSRAAELPGATADLSGLDARGLVALALGLMLLLAPRGFPLRWVGLPLLATALATPAPRLYPGGFELHLLDVGQGLSVVVETRHHALVFDTGPEYRSGFSTAEAVVAPFLSGRGIRRIDRLVLSHGDQDHAGGLRVLRRRFDIGSVHSGEPDRIALAAERCRAGDSWRWDGVAFEYLHPPAAGHYAGNDASCVLRVSNAAGAVLLTGDIGRGVEAELVRHAADRLRSHVVVAPHHGSRSSSSPAFATATRPGYVLYASGWANRYGFPAAEVDRRWRLVGARPLNTAQHGALQLRYRADGSIAGPLGWRDAARRFWWHASGSAEPDVAVSSGD